MVQPGELAVPGLKPNVSQDVKEVKPKTAVQKPVFQEEKSIDVKSENANVQDNQIVLMQRVDKRTAIQLIDDKGMPEAYLDSVNTGVMMFRERQDYDICQIVDEKTGKPLAYIGGYALQINFNMSELTSMERIDQCLNGIVKLFRHKIMTQTFGKQPPKD